MDANIRKKIIREYKKGKSSLEIVKIVGLSKPTILKVLNEEGIIRKRDRCQKLDIKFDGENYYILSKCKTCGEEKKHKSYNKTLVCRNYHNLKNLNCKKCSLKLQVGEGNPFYGKKHTKESLKKMTKTLTENPRKFSSSSKPEKKIESILKRENFDVIRTYRVKEYVCDIFIKELNLIIEYNGDYWHCNPIKYEPDYMHPHKKKLASQIWEDDKTRIDNLKSYGYNLEVIWEKDFIDDKSIIQLTQKYVKNKSISSRLR